MSRTPNAVEEWQIKYLYTAVYNSLGYIDKMQVSRINDHAIKSLPALRKAFNTFKQEDKAWALHARFSKRVPKLSEVIQEFQEAVYRVETQKLDEKWRWFMRDEGDNLIFRYVMMYGSTTKAARKLGEGLVWQINTGNAELEMLRGESYYAEKDSAYLDQYKQNTYMLMGKDKTGAPMAVSRLRYHDPKGQSRESAERIVINLLEHALLATKDRSRGGTIIWDCQGYKSGNRDYRMIAFLSNCCSKCYPAIADRLIYFKAPKIFEIGWNIIQTQTDPGFRKRVMFINKVEDLLKYVSDDQLPKFMGGNSPYDATQWVDPSPEDNLYMKDKKTRGILQDERNSILQELQLNTVEWILDTEDSQEERDKIWNKLSTNFWTLDPYVRCRTIWDRHGTMGVCRQEYAAGGIAQPTCHVVRPTHSSQKTDLSSKLSKLDLKSEQCISGASTLNLSQASSRTNLNESNQLKPYSSKVTL